MVGVSRWMDTLLIFASVRGDVSKNNGNFDMFASYVHWVDMKRGERWTLLPLSMR